MVALARSHHCRSACFELAHNVIMLMTKKIMETKADASAEEKKRRERERGKP